MLWWFVDGVCQVGIRMKRKKKKKKKKAAMSIDCTSMI